jgi:class 3 adenylate cyclase
MSGPPDPPPSPVERRLATILVADVVGYSRMMGEDEERTVQTLRGHRAVFDDTLKTYRGRVFNTAGDAILAEFPSAVDAVRCATEIQAALRTRNEQLPDDRQMWFRIGINLGDVVVQDGDLLGEGVNIAARIQTIAEPGGISLSGSVYDQIQNKLSLQFKSLGEQRFKNIAQPIRTFAIGDGPRVSTAARPGPGKRATPSVVAIGVLAALVALAGVAYALYRDHAQRQAEDARIVAEAERKAAQARADAAQLEAKNAAELRAAREALAQAEAGKQKAEQDKAAAEAAQREAKLAAELRAARDALQKPGPGTSATAAAPAAAQNAQSVDRFDGTYTGTLCKVVRDGSTRCWTVSLTSRQGALSATWSNRASPAKAQAAGAIAADGSARLALDAFDTAGKPLKGTMTGQWANDALTFAGTWDDGTAANATLTRSPEGTASAATGRAAGTRRVERRP